MESTTALLQSALTPAFLLVALSGLLTLYAMRLSRIIDRARAVQANYAVTTGKEHENVVIELRGLSKRIATVNWSIALGVLSAIVVSVLIGILFLMGMAGFQLASYAAFAFLVAIILMCGSLILFMIEVRMATRLVQISKDYLKISS
jgi:magnesium-transporting ATPase (P-type)